MRTKQFMKAFDMLANTLASNMIKAISDNRTWMGEQFNQIHQSIASIQPSHVDMTQELADSITKKLHGPLTISQEASDWLRSIASHGDVSYTMPIGFTSMGGRAFCVIKTDGAFYLELTGPNGEPIWLGTFVPPGYGRDVKTDE